ncbi:MAG: phosphohistidine phosphatase SixA [Planctomycetota bacterium]
MSVTLLVIRHGKAQQDNYDRDQDRTLTDRGERQARGLAGLLEEHDLAPNVIVSSPFVRARQTAELIAGAFGLEPDFDERLSLSASGSVGGSIELLGELDRANDDATIAIVGHQPLLERTIAVLTEGLTGFGPQVRTGECFVLQPNDTGRFAIKANLRAD